MVGQFLTIWGRLILFFCTARSILQYTTVCKGSNFSTFFSSHQHLLFSDFLIVTILKGVRWHPVVLLFKVKVRVINSSHVRLFTTPWTIDNQAPLSMEFFRQEYWSGLPFPSPKLSSLSRYWTPVSCIAGKFFTIWANREPPFDVHFPNY